MTTPTFLVLRGGAIGDFICTLPALQALRNRWPGCRIHLVGYPHVGRLARACGAVDSFASLDRSEIAGLFVAETELTDFQRRMASGCDIALSYLHDPMGTVCQNLSRAGAPRVLYGSPQVLQGHAIDWLMRPLESLGVKSRGRESSEIDIPEDLSRLAAHHLPPDNNCKPRLLIHPGSGSPSKNWSARGFAMLAGEIMRLGEWQTLILIGEADRAVEAEMRRETQGLRFITPPDLLCLAGILGRAQAYIGNDSGVTHLAAAVGLPVLALFGPSDPERWAPRNPGVSVLRADPEKGGLPALSPATVREAFGALIARVGLG